MLLSFNLLPLIIVFGFLALLDIIGWKKIGLIFIIVGAFLLFFLNKFLILKGILLILGLISIVIIVLIKSLGAGDKIVLSASFLIYPFYIIGPILIIALLISRESLNLEYFILHKLKRNVKEISIPFYPFLFFSTIIIYILLEILNHI